MILKHCNNTVVLLIMDDTMEARFSKRHKISKRQKFPHISPTMYHFNEVHSSGTGRVSKQSITK